MDKFVYVFGYGNPGGTPLKVTTMRVFESIDPIIETLLTEFSNEYKRYNISSNDTPFERFLSRYRNPPKVYTAKLNDPEFVPKRMNPTKWRKALTNFGQRHPEKIAKLLLNGDIVLDKQTELSFD